MLISRKPQFIQPRRFDELTKDQRSSGVAVFCRGAIRSASIGLVPVLLIVGTLNYMANGWNQFSQELLDHWPLTIVPLVLVGLIGGIIAMFRR